MKNIFIIILIFISAPIFSQKINGEVIGIENEISEKIFGAIIRSKSKQVKTDLEGRFVWELENKKADTIIISAVTYVSDTLVISDIKSS